MLLRKTYGLYADFVLKNPFYTLDMQVPTKREKEKIRSTLVYMSLEQWCELRRLSWCRLSPSRVGDGHVLPPKVMLNLCIVLTRRHFPGQFGANCLMMRSMITFKHSYVGDSGEAARLITSDGRSHVEVYDSTDDSDTVSTSLMCSTLGHTLSSRICRLHMPPHTHHACTARTANAGIVLSLFFYTYSSLSFFLLFLIKLKRVAGRNPSITCGAACHGASDNLIIE